MFLHCAYTNFFGEEDLIQTKASDQVYDYNILKRFVSEFVPKLKSQCMSLLYFPFSYI